MNNKKLNIKLNPKLGSDKMRDKLIIFSLCFFISAGFWAMIKLSKDYTLSINYPVIYQMVPENKVIVNDLDSIWTIKIKADGFSLLKVKYFQKPKPIKVSIDKLKKKYIAGKEQCYLVSATISDEIAKQLGFDAKVVTINPDTIYFFLEHRYKKIVPVSSNLKLGFKKQYFQYGNARFEPDSVILYGHKDILDTIKAVNFKHYEINNIEGNVNKELYLNINNNYRVWSNVNVIKVRIPVEKYTEATFQTAVKPVNLPNKFQIKLFPEKISITCLVALKDYKRINNQDFQAVIDFNKISKTESSRKLKPEIIQMPEMIKITSVNPEKVEYLLIK